MNSNTVNWLDLLKKLADPFPATAVQWRAGRTSKDKTRAQALPYAEPRVYEDRLNELCPGDWALAFEPWGATRIICRLTIHGLSRASTGEAGDSPPSIAGTAAEAQAFKRACSKFGLGRYLYDLPTSWVAYDAQTKRLLETPRLSAPQAAPLPVSSDTLGNARASALHRELAVLGIGRSKHYSFASEVLKRPVESFTELTEEDGKAVWNAAKRNQGKGSSKKAA